MFLTHHPTGDRECTFRHTLLQGAGKVYFDTRPQLGTKYRTLMVNIQLHIPSHAPYKKRRPPQIELRRTLEN